MAESGQYVGISCSNCRGPVLVTGSLTGEKWNRGGPDDGPLTCPECGRDDSYEFVYFTLSTLDTEPE